MRSSQYIVVYSTYDMHTTVYHIMFGTTGVRLLQGLSAASVQSIEKTAPNHAHCKKQSHITKAHNVYTVSKQSHTHANCQEK